MGVPIYLIALAAFSTRESLNQFPLVLLPVNFSTETIGSSCSRPASSPGSSTRSRSGWRRWSCPSSSASQPGMPWPASRSAGEDALPAVPAVHPGPADRRAVRAARAAVPRRRACTTRSSRSRCCTRRWRCRRRSSSRPASSSACRRRGGGRAGSSGCTPLQAFRQVVLPLAAPGHRRRDHLHLRAVLERGPRRGHPHPEQPHAAGAGALVARATRRSPTGSRAASRSSCRRSSSSSSCGVPVNMWGSTIR